MAHLRRPKSSHIVTVSRETWQELLEIAGHQIDPENAEVCWSFTEVADPYGVHPKLALEYDCIGRFYFARNSGSSVWIEFGDLPEPQPERHSRGRRAIRWQRWMMKVYRFDDLRSCFERTLAWEFPVGWHSVRSLNGQNASLRVTNRDLRSLPRRRWSCAKASAGYATGSNENPCDARGRGLLPPRRTD